MSKYNLQLTRLDSTLNTEQGLVDIEASLHQAQKILNELNDKINALTIRVKALEDA
jgi:capsule polysaccharide export protein KpsE/RkpR